MVSAPGRRAEANLTRFTEYVAATRGLRFAGYNELWRWSVTDLEGFWAAVWEFFGLDEVSGYDRALGRDTMPGAEWFPGARLNFAGHLLDQGDAEATAIVGTDESGVVTTLTRVELRDQVGALAATLRAGWG